MGKLFVFVIFGKGGKGKSLFLFCEGWCARVVSCLLLWTCVVSFPFFSMLLLSVCYSQYLFPHDNLVRHAIDHEGRQRDVVLCSFFGSFSSMVYCSKRECPHDDPIVCLFCSSCSSYSWTITGDDNDDNKNSRE